MALFNFLNPENHPKKIHNLLYGPSHLRGHLLRNQIKIFGVLKSLASSVPKAVIDSPLVIIFLKTYSSGFARSFEERCCDACIAIAEGKKVAKKRGGQTLAQNLVNQNTKKSNERIVRILN